MAKDFSKYSILIAEDHSETMTYFKEILEDTKIKIIEVNNGLDAIEIFKENPKTNFVLLDIFLPGLIGTEAIREIKITNPKVPVFATTSHFIAVDKQFCRGYGFDEHFPKPVDAEFLINSIEQYVCGVKKASNIYY